MDDRACVGVVMASGGYPSSYETGRPIDGLDRVDESAAVFYAGARRDGARVLTDGGRVLLVTASGQGHRRGASRAYDNVRRIEFEGAHYRTDIAARAVEGRWRGGGSGAAQAREDHEQPSRGRIGHRTVDFRLRGNDGPNTAE